jgi:aerobic-type carbon monoxide dehydrogenase small subunit (CoxS/CutS family)
MIIPIPGSIVSGDYNLDYSQVFNEKIKLFFQYYLCQTFVNGKRSFVFTIQKYTIMALFSLNINGEKRNVDVDPSTPMLWVLRDHLRLVGTKYGCMISQCGSCTILLGDIAVRSCQLPISAVGSQEVTTIEGLSENGDHPVQKAWLEHDVPQCGYCQAGQIMNAVALLRANPHPTDEDIETAMHGNLCRCGTYTRIKAAIKTASGS